MLNCVSKVCDRSKYVSRASTHLQCTTWGPSRWSSRALIFRRKSNRLVAISGTPMLGHMVNWKWHTVRVSCKNKYQGLFQCKDSLSRDNDSHYKDKTVVRLYGETLCWQEGVFILRRPPELLLWNPWVVMVPTLSSVVSHMQAHILKPEQNSRHFVDAMGLLPDTQNCGLCMRWECRERFPRQRLQRKSLVSDPGMHHGTCVTHLPWCMSGSLTRGDGENVPGSPGACATRKFTYLARGPCSDAFSCDQNFYSKFAEVFPMRIIVFWVLIDSGYGLAPNSDRPLPKPVLIWYIDKYNHTSHLTSN